MPPCVRDLRVLPGAMGVTSALPLSEKRGRNAGSTANCNSANLRGRDAPAKSGACPSAGPGWFDMQGAPRTPELEADLRLLAHRAALDPRHHYRRGVTAALAPRKDAPFPVVQLGTVVEDPTAFYSDRLPRRMRARTVLDTLMRDVERHQTLKRRYAALKEAAHARVVRAKPSRRRP